MFLCKDRPSDCSPETSLEQLRLKRSPETDGVSERSSQLVFTINEATPSASGTYQCCAKSQKTEILLQGHFFSVSVTGELLTPLIAQAGLQQGQQLGTVGVSGPEQAVSLRKSPSRYQSLPLSPTGQCCLPKKVISFCLQFQKILLRWPSHFY